MREGGSIPVVGLFKTHLGVDTLLVGWGQDDDNLHGPNEKFSLADFHRGIKASRPSAGGDGRRVGLTVRPVPSVVGPPRYRRPPVVRMRTAVPTDTVKDEWTYRQG